MMTPEINDALKKDYKDKKAIVLFGIETHICIQQTALDLLKSGYDVHVIADAVSSRTSTDRLFALKRMKQCGAFITTHESLLFMLLKDAKNQDFKCIQNLIKNLPEDPDIF
ncbi:hypothetical protein MXB_3209 [Myxobolus squamalis]|nr:hypothetical protein MXB_3209 [Myxobolus squamalis]